MSTETTLLFSVLFGAIGFAYFVYGKKQRELIPALAGIGLCVFPYFISNTWTMVLIGAALTVAPWLIRL
jgi:hypothetical protein